MRYTLILPVIALLLYSFAKPEYSVAANIQTTQDGVVKGRVVLKDGKPLEMVAIIINGTTTATATDAEGKFTLNGVSRDATLNVVHYGYIPMVVRPRFDSEMKITLEEDNKGQFNGVNSMTPPPPPPPPPAYSFPDGKKPLILVDGKITDISIQQIDPETIESISVWKDKTATDKYGDKGKDGVIEIRLKKNTGSNEVIVVEGKPLNGESSAIIVRSASASSSNEPVTVIGYGQPKEGFLYLVDGEVKDKAFVDALGTDKIESMSVWKGQKAIDKYGEKGRNGVIEIVTKK